MSMKQQFQPRYGIQQKPPTKFKRFYQTSKHLLFLLLLLSSVLLVSLTYYNFRHSLDWSTNKNGLKMAQMSPDMLQDSPAQIKVKENFLRKAQQIMPADGSLHAKKSDLLLLNGYLTQIKTAKPQYQKQYEQIAAKYQIKMALASLFTKKKVTANLKTVTQVLLKIGPDLNDMHQKNPHDRFVAQQMTIIHVLNHDLRLINLVATNTQALLTIKKQIGTFQPTVVPVDFSKAVKPENKLIYHWQALNQFDNLQNDIQAVLTKQEQKINLYHSYQQDLSDKAKAYDDLRKARASHAANNEQVLAQIRAEKLAAEKQKEAEKKAKAEAEKKAKADTTQTDTDQDNDEQTTKPDKDKDQNKETTNQKKPAKTQGKDKPKDHYIDPDDETKSDANVND